MPEFLQTDFGDAVYDRWYLTHGSYNFETPEFVARHLPFYEAVLRLSKTDSILEAGCGTGSYARAFARRGYHVVGLDLSPHFLSEAQKLAQNENLDIRFLLGDYNAMSFTAAFSVIFFEGSFFYRSEAGLANLLSRIYAALTPGGRLYFVHPNPAVSNRRFPMARWSETEQNVFVMERGEYDAEADIERYTWLSIDLPAEQYYRCDYTCKHLPPDRLKDSLAAAGFTDTRFYKKRQMADFCSTDPGFSVVAKK